MLIRNVSFVVVKTIGLLDALNTKQKNVVVINSNQKYNMTCVKSGLHGDCI